VTTTMGKNAGHPLRMNTQSWVPSHQCNARQDRERVMSIRDSKMGSHRLRAESILASALICALCTRCLTSISLPQVLPQSHRCALLSRKIRCARRRILPDLVMRGLVDRFERTLGDDTLIAGCFPFLRPARLRSGSCDCCCCRGPPNISISF
jgi:hypothetical protein